MARSSRRKRRTSSKVPAGEVGDNFSFGDPHPSKSSSRRLVEPNEANPLGGMTEAELAEVAETDFGSDPELEAPETGIAVEGLARVIAARMDHADWVGDPKLLAIFVFSDRPRELAETLKAQREPILDNGSRPITGKLWVTGPNFASGYFIPLAAADPSGLFSEAQEKGIGDMAALIFDPTATDPEIRYYPRGLNEPDHVQRFLIAEKVFTLDTLDKGLTLFHESNVITPDAAGRSFNPWHDGAKYVPRKETEAFLQGWLKSILGVAFRGGCVVRFEVPGTEGRCDLLILSRHATNANAWVCHAALELKVLRSFSVSARTVSSTVRQKAVKDGLLQAIAYKREQSAKYGMLCCFDMRTPRHCDGDACFNPIKARAKRNMIQLRRYRLYGSAADLRAEKYGGSLPTT